MKKSEYLAEVNRVSQYTGDDWWEGKVPKGTPTCGELTERFIESGGCAWGHPVFEREVFKVLIDWLCDEKNDYNLKAWLYARSLLEQLPDNAWSDVRDKLSQLAEFKWTEDMGITKPIYLYKRCAWPALPEEYLKHWNWPMFEFATKFWEEKRKLKKAKFDLIRREQSRKRA